MSSRGLKQFREESQNREYSMHFRRSRPTSTGRARIYSKYKELPMK